MTYKLICKFKFEGERHVTDIPSVANIANGFWVDDYYNFTIDPDKTTYWIPPSKIYYVEKIGIWGN